ASAAGGGGTGGHSSLVSRLVWRPLAPAGPGRRILSATATVSATRMARIRAVRTHCRTISASLLLHLRPRRQSDPPCYYPNRLDVSWMVRDDRDVMRLVLVASALLLT